MSSRSDGERGKYDQDPWQKEKWKNKKRVNDENGLFGGWIWAIYAQVPQNPAKHLRARGFDQTMTRDMRRKDSGQGAQAVDQRP